MAWDPHRFTCEAKRQLCPTSRRAKQPFPKFALAFFRHGRKVVGRANPPLFDRLRPSTQTDAAMKRSNENPTVPTRVKSVLVVYETPAVRELAVRFCDQLSERHRSRARLEITWWSFAFL